MFISKCHIHLTANTCSCNKKTLILLSKLIIEKYEKEFTRVFDLCVVYYNDK